MKLWCCVIASALVGSPALAFKLQAFGPSQTDIPVAGANRQALAFMRQFTVDVHERITRQAYARAGIKLPDEVIAGVRWNDNPPALRLGALLGNCNGMQLIQGLDCWTSMMRLDRFALEALTRREKSIAPVRSHFGDMQFLHAMASHSGEPAVETRRNILRWSEFAYRVARGEIDPKANVFGLRGSGAVLDEETSAWISDLFRSPSKKLWAVHDMFLAKPEKIRLMAFGSLLHVVEDSYSSAHARREGGRIQSNGCLAFDADSPIVLFQTYVGQDTEKHGVCDDAPDWLDTERSGSPIEVLAQIARAYHEGAEWPAVKAILESRVFRLAESVPPARPGHCFEWRLDEATANAGTEHVVAIDPACQKDDEPR